MYKFLYDVLGFLRERTGTYQAGYAICGGFMIIAAIVLLLEPITRRLQEKMEIKDADDIFED